LGAGGGGANEMAVSMAARRLRDKAKRDPALNAALNAWRQKLQMLNV
jgi:ribulose 1,5-bisphosphate carboxylase large subunit-like protein